MEYATKIKDIVKKQTNALIIQKILRRKTGKKWVLKLLKNIYKNNRF